MQARPPGERLGVPTPDVGDPTYGMTRSDPGRAIRVAIILAEWGMTACVATYQRRATSILENVSTPRNLGRASLGLLAVVAGLGCCLLVGALAIGGISTGQRDDAVLLAWGAGLVAAALSVLAAQEHTDPDDDPRYLATIVHGLRQEWRR